MRFFEECLLETCKPQPKTTPFILALTTATITQNYAATTLITSFYLAGNIFGRAQVCNDPSLRYELPSYAAPVVKIGPSGKIVNRIQETISAENWKPRAITVTCAAIAAGLGHPYLASSLICFTSGQIAGHSTQRDAKYEQRMGQSSFPRLTLS